ncbi:MULTISPECIES: acetyl-CoA acetyltransferase [Rhodococcus]|uniref:Acetyl-CoA acetyltransferase n=1 Tax=Rhodococcus aetherivorans TaxID=191292 RepID=A0AA46SE07_9NOCA|nr:MULTISPECIES: acetyl-CoA acetyltransferase [Rhodococcus]MBC2590150.1 thiolase domain-containing protein [Rhodococcus aetherivorans]MDV6293173.1 acetyl-CoA acetyltransferase [Rhodococcus aetherivorans]NGP26932.1 thiolase domain-containing protein [Rhodococcus aetherivorans]QIX52877.1 thiolase domain-containing protein [Rhodococcus sp. DMU1]UGQ41452.1 acetyl-CoA acetyltransferase [Rhodococcus aetherivorans]
MSGVNPEGVWIAGGYQSDFARNLTREDRNIADLVAETVTETLRDARIDVADVGVIHVGNAFGQLYTGQGHLGGMPASVLPELWGIPATRHEGACASGSLAVLAAMADLEAGRYDCALVLGVELERCVPGDAGTRVMNAAAWVGQEGADAKYMWPYMFDKIADEYDRRYGLDDEHLRAIAELNIRNARANPNAQTRNRTYGPGSFGPDEAANPVVEGRLRRTDCSPLTDGAAGVVLLSNRYLSRHPRTVDDMSRILGWGHRTVGLSLSGKLARDGDDPLVMPHVRATIVDAFERSGIGGVRDLDLIETHDCFTVSEYLAVDHFGITAPGRSWQAIENGDLEIGGRIPMNPSGGLLGGGHPVGATGVRMLLDCHRQITGRAGDYQVPGATRAATLNIGGSTTTTVSFVVG